VLGAIEPIREQLGRIALVGHDWGAMPHWVESPLREDAYYTDPAYLGRLGVEVLPPVPIERVVAWMSRATFNPVIYRPLFEYLRLVTCRTFETPAAGTIPLFGLDPGYVRELYGEAAAELVLTEGNREKILDIVSRPEHYAAIVRSIRRHLAERHSYAARLRQLIQIIES
jgi:glycosyltransferase involved in cell wall biosynthesis